MLPAVCNQIGINDSCIIDDTYNANPASVRAAIDALSNMDGKRVLILGDMAELGEHSAGFHRDIGEYIRKKILIVVYGWKFSA